MIVHAPISLRIHSFFLFKRCVFSAGYQELRIQKREK